MILVGLFTTTSIIHSWCAMHSYMARADPLAPQARFAHGYLACATGSTFRDNTSPSNFEPIVNAHQQLAQHLWHQPMMTTLVAPYLPPVELSPPPTPAEVAAFSQADLDSQHTGVLDSQGNHKELQYDHHVDDCMYSRCHQVHDQDSVVQASCPFTTFWVTQENTSPTLSAKRSLI